jgi:hypothetical protein
MQRRLSSSLAWRSKGQSVPTYHWELITTLRLQCFEMKSQHSLMLKSDVSMETVLVEEK